MSLTIDVEDHGPSRLLVLRGELGLATAPQLREALVDVLCEGCHIVVDLEGVEFVDSVGLGILLGGLKRARGHGGQLELVCTSRAVLRPFELTGVDKLLTIHPTRDAVLGAR